MKTNIILNGLCLPVTKSLPDESVDCVISSPPYWQLRDYGFPEQWGLEPTFQEYLSHLWSLMDEIYRVLKPSGTVWINLGDTYGTKSGNMADPNGKYASKERTHGQESINIVQQDSIHKCLLLIPHRFGIGCIDRGWIVRNDIIWAKRNGMPESVTDRFSKKHEYIFFMVKEDKYYFDLDSIRGTHSEESKRRALRGNTKKNKYAAGNHLTNGDHPNTMSQPRKFQGYENMDEKIKNGDTSLNHKGKNPGDVSDFWDIVTKGNKSAHYATYNFKLIEKCIVAGCPKGGVILDPFCGTGTTGVRALQLGRQFIWIEGNKEFADIANRNLDAERLQPQIF